VTETLERAEPAEPESQPASPSAAAGNTVGENSGVVNNTYNNFAPPNPEEDVDEITTDLVDGPIPAAMVAEAVEAFCHPGEYNKALRILRERKVLVLCGVSTGRTLAAVRMFIDLNLETFQQLDPLRPLSDFSSLKKPAASTGYLWDDLTGNEWATGLTGRTLSGFVRFLNEADSFLIIALSSDDVRHAYIDAYLTELVAPDTADVAKAHLSARGIPCSRHSELLSQVDLNKALPGYSRPNRGAEVARQLAEADRGLYDFDEVKENLHRRQDEDVKAWFEKNKDVQIRALAISIAFLEGCPYNAVVAGAKKLEDALKNPENQEIWPYRPPNLFWESRGDRLRRAQAKQKPTNYRHIDPERVAFTRPDWGQRLLHYVWKEHERIRPVLHTWLADVSRNVVSRSDMGHDEAMTRFGTLLAQAAEPDVMRWVWKWAIDPSEDLQSLAAMTLRGMSENSSYVKVIKNHLHAWCNPKARTSYRMTAALALGGAFGRSQPEFALLRLRRLTKNATELLEFEIAAAIRSLLMEPNNRSMILSTLPIWLLEGGRTSRRVALRCALDALSLNGNTISFSDNDSAAVRLLVAALLEDGRLRRRAILGLTRWAATGEFKSESSSHVLGLLRLLFSSPDDVLIRRLSFYLRKALNESPQKTAPLRNALSQVLKETSDV